jgi:hypothetical protein
MGRTRTDFLFPPYALYGAAYSVAGADRGITLIVRG